ncbi:MAG: glycosyltransferase family A protein, partial [Candidatus Micrarchaeaceae archaeon]
MKPKLGIYATSFNVEKTCEQTINSLLGLQRYFDIKFFIVDNYSIDNTINKLNKIFIKNAIKNSIIQIKSSRGKGRDLAMGIAEKENMDFLMYVDLDCLYNKNFIKYCKSFINKKVDVGLSMLSKK